MSKISAILSKIVEANQNPLETARAYCKENSKKAVGCVKGYIPEELIHAFGLLPVGLWGSDIPLVESQKYVPSFYCAPTRQILEQGIRGDLDFLSAVAIPSHCDTLKALGQNWKIAVSKIPFIHLTYPHNRKQEFGKRFLYSELARIKQQLEEISAKTYSENDLGSSICIYNNYRKTMREFLDCAMEYPVTITPLVRHQIVSAGLVLEKGEYAKQLKILMSLLKEQPTELSEGKRVVVTGTMLNHYELLESLEQQGIQIVADDLLQESRMLKTDVPKTSDPMQGLVEQWANREGCSLVYDPEKKRGKMLVELAQRTKADGVIFCITTFCDPDEYDYPPLRNALREANIPNIRVELGESAKTAEQARTRMQGFVEMLS